MDQTIHERVSTAGGPRGAGKVLTVRSIPSSKPLAGRDTERCSAKDPHYFFSSTMIDLAPSSSLQRLNCSLTIS